MSNYITSAEGSTKNYKGETVPAIFGLEGVISGETTIGNTANGKEYAKATLKLADKKVKQILSYAGCKDKKEETDTITLLCSAPKTIELMKNLKDGQKVFVAGEPGVNDKDYAKISVNGLIPYPAKGEDVPKEFYSMDDVWPTGSRKLLATVGVVTKGKVFGKEGPVVDQDADGNPRIAFSMRTGNRMGFVNKTVNKTEDENTTNFITVTITGPTVEKLQEYLKPGKMVLILGSFYVKVNGQYTNYSLYVNDTKKGHYGKVVLLGDAKTTTDETTTADTAKAATKAAPKAAKKAAKETPKEETPEAFSLDELFDGGDVEF